VALAAAVVALAVVALPPTDGDVGQ